MQRFLKGDHDVCFHIGPSLGCRTAPAEPTECGSAASAAKKRFEEIAEPSPTKLELDAAPSIASPLIKSAAGLLTLPLRRGLETAWPVPIGPKLIIFRPLLRIAQDLVRFVDLLEFFFGNLFILGHIRVVLARQLAKSAANFLLIRGFRHAECLVIISKLNWHLLSSLCLRLNRATFCMMRELGKLIVIIGVVVTMVGLLMWSGIAKWLGRLPGDIRIEREHSAFYFPMVTCIILNIVFSVVFSLFSMFRR